MKAIILITILAAVSLLPSCSPIEGVSGRVVTEDGEFTVQPDGRIEIIVNPRSSK